MSTVLFLTRELPYPPNAGDRIVTYGYVRGLAERGHEVHVLTHRSSESAADVAALREYCESIVRVPGDSSRLPPTARKVTRAARKRSDVMAMFDSSAIRTATPRRIAALEPDAVVAQHPYLGQRFRDETVRRAARAAGAALVTNAHVVEYAAHERHREHADDRRTRAELALELPRLRREELAAYRASDLTLVLGAADATRLREQGVGPVSRERVGLEIDAYEPAPLDSDSDRLVFFGSYDWFPNEDAALVFARRVFPRIRAAHPDAELALAGRGATDELRDLGNRPGIEFRGGVDDLESVVRDAAVMVAPLRVGGGIRIKVLESMAWRLPIVTTAQGFEGVEATPGEDLRVADDWDEFVDATVELLEDPDERRHLATNARETIADRYVVDEVAAELEETLGLER
ncbi:glycosyltransferase family 4 protein [Natrinema sp. 74]|uniref:glycosyltransferase family 4 protein n=1 Tax=Natrinema sp. 74 TaxID=3384159 RepID=UPI0038D3C53A